LEGLVFAERVARDLAATPPLDGDPPTERWTVPQLRDRGAAQVSAERIRHLMWERSGIARTARGLRSCAAELRDILARLHVGATEEINMAQTALLVTEAALIRRESRGGHFRSDFPREARRW